MGCTKTATITLSQCDSRFSNRGIRKEFEPQPVIETTRSEGYQRYKPGWLQMDRNRPPRQLVGVLYVILNSKLLRSVVLFVFSRILMFLTAMIC